MTDYNTIDALILEAISTGRTAFCGISSGAVREEAKRLAQPPRSGKLGVDEAGRLVDRRLQALRKAGRIAYSHRTGWHAVAAGVQEVKRG